MSPTSPEDKQKQESDPLEGLSETTEPGPKLIHAANALGAVRLETATKVGASIGKKTKKLASAENGGSADIPSTLCRIILMRHLKTNRELADEKRQIEGEASKDVLDVDHPANDELLQSYEGFFTNNTVIFYVETEKERVLKTVTKLKTRFPHIELLPLGPIPHDVQDILQTSNPDSSIPDLERSTRNNKLTQFMHQVIGSVLRTEAYSGKTIVILGGTRLSAPFEDATQYDLYKFESIDSVRKGFEEDRYLIADYWQSNDQKRSLKPGQYVQIIPSNSREFSVVFPEVDDCAGDLVAYQNAINEKISADLNSVDATERLESWLKSNVLNLRTFALHKLIEHKKFDVLCRYYFGLEKEKTDETAKRKFPDVTEREREILLKHFGGDPKIRQIVAALFSLQDNWEDSIKDTNLKARLKTYREAVQIQERSLDQTIKDQEQDAIIPREVSVKRMKDRAHPIDIRTILTSKTEAGFVSYVLPAMVGAGKSLWLTELVKHAILEYPDKEIVFIEGKNLNDATLKTIEYRVTKNPDAILVIDAFDEISSDVDKKKTILEAVKTGKFASVKKIITGRPTEFSDTDENPGFETLQLTFNRNEFIRQKGGNKTSEILAIFKRIKTRYVEEDNPLFTYFVCELANNYEKYCKRLKIKSLDEILDENKDTPDKIKPMLYENVIKLIIVRHEEGKEERKRKFGDDMEVNEARFREMFAQLSNLAMGQELGKTYQETFETDGMWKFSQREFFDTVNVLFKKGSNDNFQFAHKSFQEYFVYNYREICFKEDPSGIKWFNLLAHNDPGPIENSIGLVNKLVFRHDLSRLITDFSFDTNTFLRIVVAIASIHEYGLTEYNELIKQIISSSQFRSNPYIIEMFCNFLGILDYEILMHLISIPEIQTHTEAIATLCGDDNNIYSEDEWYDFFMHLVVVPAFINNFENTLRLIRRIGHSRGFSRVSKKDSRKQDFRLLRKISRVTAFRNEPEFQRFYDEAVERIELTRRKIEK